MTTDFFYQSNRVYRGERKLWLYHGSRQLHHPRTMEVQVQSEASPCWTCGGKSGTMTNFTDYSSVLGQTVSDIPFVLS